MTDKLIDECENEQLHLSGQIQAAGALLVADGDFRISHFSANLGGYLALDEVPMPGQALPEALALLVKNH
ncbi:MAG: hypothetical protein OIF35_00480, partial [Cellvibrionaceae bacterium]|nr:hypothetical protein [Cellvibrionaceae bacterium]